jgi:transcriptional regulator with XRE-family HTH domain
MEYWARVKKLIKSQNTTQEWLANHCEISLNTFKGWIAKKVLPNAAQAVAIAAALNTTVEYLVTGIEPPAQLAAGSMAQEYSQVIENLKVLDSKVRAGFVSAIHYAAEEARRGENREKGPAAG